MPRSPTTSFLEDYLATRWQPEVLPDGLVCEGIYLGAPTAGAVEIVYLHGIQRPRLDDLRRAWRDRSARRPTPVLVVAGYATEGRSVADVVGLHDDRSVQRGLDLGHVERLSVEALDAGTTAEAERLLASLFLGSADVDVPGLRNEGLFAGYELDERVPERADWSSAVERSKAARGHRGIDLLTALGWHPRPRGSTGYLLVEGEATHAVAVLLQGDEVFDRRASRFGDASPVEHGLAVALAEQLPWVLAVQGDAVRLYAANPDVGVGRKGATATFTELQLRVLPEDRLGYIDLLLTPGALAEGGSVAQILASSSDHATGLGARLRERVYTDVVPRLAETVAGRLGAATEQELREAYHVTLVVLFRLLFVAYAEDRALLPYRVNTVYTRVALKTRAREYTETLAEDGDISFDDGSTELWRELLEIWRAVDEGDREWGVPEYSGGLFSSTDGRGRAIARLRLTDAEIGPALEKLLVDTGRDGTRGPVDFKALSVREFGTVYEGLLESSLSLAPGDLALDAKDNYVPATASDDVVVPAGQVYFHNASGARKATGSYFTKQFAVEHLLRTALEPAIDDHLARVAALADGGDEAGAADAFFDLRIADIAMGSGHFLVGAIDHVAVRFSAFLTQRPLARVEAELARLRQTAFEKLDAVGVTDLPEIDQATLLRRQIARRCIYGVDINQIAVDLARLAVWIHTFVPGLPMSALDHGLVQGNSLTGIGTLDEALDVLTAGPKGKGKTSAGTGQMSVFEQPIHDALEAARSVLARVSRTAEATAAEVKEAAEAHEEALLRSEPAKALLDAAVAGRLGMLDLPLLSVLGPDAVMDAGRRVDVVKRMAELDGLHFPVAFPEVFLRERPGFDLILGNPPWEKVHVEAHQWWGLHFPGLRSERAASMGRLIEEYRDARPDLREAFETEVIAADALREVISAGPFPGIGAGHIDLYKAFCWRGWSLLSAGARAGIVLPRGALSGSGTLEWRREVLAHGTFENVCFLSNSGQWIFSEVHPQYTVALTTMRRGGMSGVRFNGPFHSLQEYLTGRNSLLSVSVDEFKTWSGGASFPLLPSNASAGVFRRMRRSPRFDVADPFSFRPVQGDLNATANRVLFSEGGNVVILAGASFNLWNPDFGTPFATADADKLRGHLQTKRLRQVRTSSSAFYGMDGTESAPLPMHSSRIALRDIARATDSRTVLAALMPPNVSLVHNAPYLLRRRGTVADEAFVLAVLCSIPFDWYARRYVELHLTFEVLAPMPVPRPSRDDRRRLRAVEVSGRLAAVDERFADWAAEVGVPVGSVTDATEKADLIAELDALVSLLYGLERTDVQHIFETFHRGWDYQPRLTAVLAHYDRWSDA